MTAGIVGLGLIGGSLAKAYKAGGHTVYGHDIDDAVLGFAHLAGACDGPLTDERLHECDVILLAVNPSAAMAYLESAAPKLPKGALVIDCCGVKQTVCARCFAIAKEHGFVFVGGHPMAGYHQSGFKYSRATLFKGASMILVPPVYDDIMLFDRVAKALGPVGFGRLTITTAKKHDEMVAYTSQMAHLVSNAYIKSPAAREHHGYSAGSYKDLTRVAYLNPDMWTELFIDNREALLKELDIFLASLQQYRAALQNADRHALRSLLDEGRALKAELDGR
jgi:prephenate dehydrogenase